MTWESLEGLEQRNDMSWHCSGSSTLKLWSVDQQLPHHLKLEERQKLRPHSSPAESETAFNKIPGWVGCTVRSEP